MMRTEELERTIDAVKGHLRGFGSEPGVARRGFLEYSRGEVFSPKAEIIDRRDQLLAKKERLMVALDVERGVIDREQVIFKSREPEVLSRGLAEDMREVVKPDPKDKQKYIRTGKLVNIRELVSMIGDDTGEKNKKEDPVMEAVSTDLKESRAGNNGKSISEKQRVIGGRGRGIRVVSGRF